MIVIDTSVLSLAYRRQPGRQNEYPAAKELARLIANDECLGIPGIVLQEVLSGIRNLNQRNSLIERLSGFNVLLADTWDHLEAARIVDSCQDQGLACSSVDALIAAQTVGLQAQLFTTDQDFERLATAGLLTLYAPN